MVSSKAMIQTYAMIQIYKGTKLPKTERMWRDHSLQVCHLITIYQCNLVLVKTQISYTHPHICNNSNHLNRIFLAKTQVKMYKIIEIRFSTKEVPRNILAISSKKEAKLSWHQMRNQLKINYQMKVWIQLMKLTSISPAYQQRRVRNLIQNRTEKMTHGNGMMLTKKLHSAYLMINESDMTILEIENNSDRKYISDASNIIKEANKLYKFLNI